MPRGTTAPIRWIMPTLGGLLAVVSYAFVLVVRGGRLFSLDGDPGRHIRVGTDILASGRIPRVDLYSHTMGGQPFIPYEWLSEIAFARVHEAAGLAGMAVLTAILLVGAVMLVYLAMVRWGVPTFLAFIFAFASFILQAMHLHARPHMFTTFLLALSAFVLLEVRRGMSPRWLLVLVPLMMVWANLHGGFLLGFILLFLFGLDALFGWWRNRERESLRSVVWYAAVGSLCFLASLATPAGIDLWPHTTGYLSLDYLVDMTQEYRSPDFHDTLMKFFMLVLLGTTVILARLRSGIDRLGLLSLVLFTAFALHSGRNIPIFGVVMIPWIATWTVGLLAQEEETFRIAGRLLAWTKSIDHTTRELHGWPTALLGCAAITVWALGAEQRQSFKWDSESFPVEAVSKLDTIEHSGPVYNEFAWGGYLLYAAWPDVPVFIDGQTDFYGVDLTKDYFRIRELRPGWQELLDRYEVGWILIPHDAPLNQALEVAAGWRQTYADSTAAAWVRATD